MRIVILVNLFPPNHIGGIEVLTLNITKELVKKGHEVHIITSSDPGLEDHSQEKGFYIHRAPLRSIKFLGIIYFWIKIFFYVKKINPDIIHAQSFEMAMVALSTKKIFKIPYIVHSHCSPYLYQSSLLLKLFKPALKNADLTIALTENMKSEISQIFNIKKIKVIPNGIILKRFILNKEYSKKGNKILCVANLRPEKGLKYLIEAMDLIIDKQKEAKLFIVGEGPEKKELLNLVKERRLYNNIVFVGKVPNEKIHEYYAFADLFVLPSLSEGLPTVLLEAMVTGVPIVATNICGMSEILENGRNGFLVTPGDPKDISEKVLMILEDSELREKITKNNINDSKKFDLNERVNQLVTIYQDVKRNYD